VVTPPPLPPEMLLRYTDVPQGRIRTRVLGARRDGVAPVVVVQGMAVSDYLLPACAALAEWTQVHLLDLPGYAGSGQPTRRLDVRGYGETVAAWLEASGIDRAVLAGHSSGTQVAAWTAALGSPHVAAVAMASPTVDPMARSLPRLLYRWRLDARSPSPGLEANHVPEWKRAGPGGIAHLIRVHLRDRTEEQVARLRVPVQLLRARGDRLSTDVWVHDLAAAVPDGEVVTLPGAHAFVWTHPQAWSEPLRRLAARVS
jgi:pimeloyl-ACP methyl ester carboxylesterase